MTRHEKMIVSAYTGSLMVPIGEFRTWAEWYLGHPIEAYELATAEFWFRIHDASKSDFERLCDR